MAPADMEPLRLRDHICRVIRPIYRNAWHGQQIAVCDIRIRTHHCFHFFDRKLSKDLHSQIKVCRVKRIHHSFSVRPQPAVHPARQGSEKHQKCRYKAGACIAFPPCQDLPQRQMEAKSFCPKLMAEHTGSHVLRLS